MTGKSNEPDEISDALSTVFEGATWVFGGRVVKLSALFFAQIIIARLLGTTNYGEAIIGILVISVGSMVAALGLPRGLTRKLPYYENDAQTSRGVLWSGYGLAMGSALVVAIGVFLNAPVIAERIFRQASLTPAVRVAGLGIPFAVLAKLSIATAKAFNDPKPHVAVKQLVTPLGRLAFMSLFVAAGFEAVGAVAGAVLASAIGGVVAIILAYRSIPISIQGPFPGMHREMLSFSMPLLFAANMGFLISNTDTFLIGALVTSSAVGLYNAAFQLRTIGMVFFFPSTFLLPPVLTRFQQDDNLGQARRTYQIVTKWMTLATLPLFLLVFLFPSIVVQVSFGPEYASATGVLRILVVSVFVTVLLGANGAALVALGHNRINLYVNGAMAALNVSLNLLLIPRFGIFGAAVASVTAFVGRDLLYSAFLYYWYGIHPFSAPLFEPLAVVGSLGIIIYPVFTTQFPTTIVTVGVLGVLGGIVYVLLLVRLDVIESEDIQTVNRLERAAGIDLDPVRSAITRVQA